MRFDISGSVFALVSSVAAALSVGVTACTVQLPPPGDPGVGGNGGDEGYDGGYGGEGDYGGYGGYGDDGGFGGYGDDGGYGGGASEGFASCFVECCDGTVIESDNHDHGGACAFWGGFGCGEAGPYYIDYEGEVLFVADTCPSMKPSRLTCCNGAEKASTAFDKDMCVYFGVLDDFCDGKGGAQRVDFGGEKAWDDNQCSAGNNCVADCCDGSKVYGQRDDAGACVFWNGYACAEDGGPTSVSYEGATTWSASSSCPTIRECSVKCADGAVNVGTAFDKDACVYLGVAGDFCDAHGGAVAVKFDGTKAWP